MKKWGLCIDYWRNWRNEIVSAQKRDSETLHVGNDTNSIISEGKETFVLILSIFLLIKYRDY